MKKILSTKYSATSFNIAMLLLRVGFGSMMLPHGYNKLMNFASTKEHFMDFLGLGQTISLSLVVFAEFFCAAFVILGLFTRLSVIPLIIAMGVALAKVNNYDLFGKGEHPAMYVVGFMVILLVGPGKWSADKLIGK